MKGLAADTQRGRDGLPTPALLAGIRDVDGLESLGHVLQRPHGAQTDGGIDAGGGLGQRIEVSHTCQGRLTIVTCQERLTT
jgi:hypothetical protein